MSVHNVAQKLTAIRRRLNERRRLAYECELQHRQAQRATFDQTQPTSNEQQVAGEALRVSEERFRSLVQNSSDVITVLDRDGTILYKSCSVERVLGYKPEEFIGKNAFALIHPEDVPEVMSAFAQVVQTQGATLSVEYRYPHKDGSWRMFESTGSNLLEHPAVAGIVVNSRDITERKQAEETLQRAKDELELRVQERTAALCKTNEQLRVELTERKRVEEALHRSARRLNFLHEIDQAILGVHSPHAIVAVALHHIKQLVPCRYASITMFDFEASEAIGANGETSGRTEEPLPWQLIGKHGEMRQDRLERTQKIVSLADLSAPAQTYETSDQPTCVEVPLVADRKVLGSLSLAVDRPTVLAPEHVDIVREVAGPLTVAIQHAWLFEQVRAGRERLRTLSNQLIEVQEAERRHIARELHDEIGQTLTGLKLLLEMSTRLPPEQLRKSSDAGCSLVNELIARVRELSLDLRPAMLDDLGLLPALLWHFDRYSAQTQVQVNFKHTGLERRFAPEVETAAYRVVQEALTNAARHASVRDVAVKLCADHNTLRMRIEDQGTGFDSKAGLTPGASNGLIGMHERIWLVGGHLAIESTPGTGTCVMASIPLTEAGQERRSEEHADDRAGG